MFPKNLVGGQVVAMLWPVNWVPVCSVRGVVRVTACGCNCVSLRLLNCLMSALDTCSWSLTAGPLVVKL